MMTLLFLSLFSNATEFSEALTLTFLERDLDHDVSIENNPVTLSGENSRSSRHVPGFDQLPTLSRSALKEHHT
jgi:hypothetical protein